MGLFRFKDLVLRCYLWGLQETECVCVPQRKTSEQVGDNGRTATETKMGLVTAKGCPIWMHYPIVRLHKGLRTLEVNFYGHVATNFKGPGLL